MKTSAVVPFKPSTSDLTKKYWFKITFGVGDDKLWDEVLDWALDYYGRHNVPDRWTCGSYCFGFRDDIDAMAFKMRWC